MGKENKQGGWSKMTKEEKRELARQYAVADKKLPENFFKSDFMVLQELEPRVVSEAEFRRMRIQEVVERRGEGKNLSFGQKIPGYNEYLPREEGIGYRGASKGKLMPKTMEKRKRHAKEYGRQTGLMSKYILDSAGARIVREDEQRQAKNKF